MCNENGNTEENRPSTSRIENKDNEDKKIMFENIIKIKDNWYSQIIRTS